MKHGVEWFTGIYFYLKKILTKSVRHNRETCMQLWHKFHKLLAQFSQFCAIFRFFSAQFSGVKGLIFSWTCKARPMTQSQGFLTSAEEMSWILFFSVLRFSRQVASLFS